MITRRIFISLLLLLCISSCLNTKVLSRKKRFLVFPEGSSFSVAVCMTIGVYGNPNYSFVSYGLNWGFAYELPTNASTFLTSSLFRESRSVETKPILKRKSRHDLFKRMEIVMSEMGYNARDCLLRALCESSQTFGRKGNNLIEELLRTIFTFPKSKVLPFEHHDLVNYDKAHRHGKAGALCHKTYPHCGFSLLDLALGKYSKPLLSFM